MKESFSISLSSCEKDEFGNPILLENVWQSCFHPSGEFVVVCCGDPKLFFISTTAKATFAASSNFVLDTRAVHGTRTIRSVDFSSCGRFLATGSFDSKVAIWTRTSSSSSRSEREHDGDGDDDMIMGVGPESWTHVATLEGHENEVKCVRWAKTGPFIATCGRDKSVWIWEKVSDDSDADEGLEFDCLAVLQEHSQDVKSLAWHPLESILASCSYDGSVKIWRQDDYQEDWFCSQTLSIGLEGPSASGDVTVWDVAFSPDGRLLAAVTADGCIHLFRLQEETGDWTRVPHSLPAFMGPIYSVVFVDNTRIAVCPNSASNSPDLFIVSVTGKTTEDTAEDSLSSFDCKISSSTKLNHADVCKKMLTASDVNHLAVFDHNPSRILATSDSSILTFFDLHQSE